MKKTVLLLSGCIMLMHIHAQKQKGFEINGVINGKDTGKVYLEIAATQKVVDSTDLQKGAFMFKGKVTEPALYMIRTTEGGGTLFVENSRMHTTFNIASMYSPIVTGSPSDSLYRQYIDRFYKYSKANMELNLQINKLFKEHKPGTPGYAVAEDSMKLLTDRFHDMLRTFITDYPSSVVAAYVIDDRLIGFGDLEHAREYVKLLQPAAVHSYYGRRIKQAFDLAAKTAIGAQVHFTQPDTSGTKIKLSDLKAKYVLIDFWASWCGPCRKENPNVVAAYRKYHDKGFDIIGVSLDQNRNAWLKAIDKDSLTWTHVSDLKGWQNAVAIQYGIKVVPTSLLVDREGKIIAKNLRGEALHKELEKLLQ